MNIQTKAIIPSPCTGICTMDGALGLCLGCGRTGDEITEWSSAGDVHGSAGGRLMITSLNLLTLEVYYRHLPLYYRDMKEEPRTK